MTGAVYHLRYTFIRKRWMTAVAVSCIANGYASALTTTKTTRQQQQQGQRQYGINYRTSSNTVGLLYIKPISTISTTTATTTTTCRRMTTAYSGIPSDGTKDIATKLPWIPYQSYIHTKSLDGNNNVTIPRLVEVGPFHSHEWNDGMELMNLIIREGRSWPFEEEFTSIDAFRGYFLSHTAFVVQAVEDGYDTYGQPSIAGDFMGCFYIKPNYPGRCSHICNGGFITVPKFRRQGIAKLMGQVFLQAAKDLGYQSSYFNLVFRSNTASVQLWESLHFERVATLENAARLNGISGLDTAYGYRYDLTKLPNDYLQSLLMAS